MQFIQTFSKLIPLNKISKEGHDAVKVKIISIVPFIVII